MANHYRKCKICGKIWSFSDKDIKENQTNSTLSAISAIGTIASVFGGTRLDTYALNSQTDRYDSKIVDYNKCPSCGTSSKYDELSESELIERENAKQKEVSQAASSPSYTINSNASVDSLIKRIRMFIEEKDFDAAQAYSEQVLDVDPENGEVYFLKAFIENKFSSADDFVSYHVPIKQSKFYKRIVQFADSRVMDEVNNIDNRIKEEDDKRKEALNRKAFDELVSGIDRATSIASLIDISNRIKKYDYNDTEDQLRKCQDKIENIKRNEYESLVRRIEQKDNEKELIEIAENINKYDYEDTRKQYERCTAKINQCITVKYKHCENKYLKIQEKKKPSENDLISLCEEYKHISNILTRLYKDGSSDYIAKANNRIKNLEDLLGKTRKKKYRNKIIIRCIAIVSVVAAIAFTLIYLRIIKPRNQRHAIEQKYNIALEKCTSRDYDSAMQIWKELERDDKNIPKLNGEYLQGGDIALRNGDYQYAEKLYLMAGYEGERRIYGDRYENALQLFEQENYEEAQIGFGEISEYKDSAEMYLECGYCIAYKALEDGLLFVAKREFEKLGDYKDSKEMISKINEIIVSQGDHEANRTWQLDINSTDRRQSENRNN